MDTNTLIIILIAVFALIFIGIVYLAVYLHKHGVNGTAVLDDIGTGITYAQSVATAIAPFLPNIADATITLILKIAAEAVQRVEATYMAATSADSGAADTRATEAKSLITSGLALKGISVTADIGKLIDAIVPVLVLALPKTHTVTQPAVVVTQAQ
jgi:hypothetical protein